MSERRLLLIAPNPRDLITVGRALRDVGYLVFPARYHELGVDGVVRVRPDLVLMDAGTYPAQQSADCRDALRQLRARVMLFSRSDASGDGAALQRMPELPYPVLEYSGDARALAALLEQLIRR